jgi:hypothetical protein
MYPVSDTPNLPFLMFWLFWSCLQCHCTYSFQILCVWFTLQFVRSLSLGFRFRTQPPLEAMKPPRNPPTQMGLEDVRQGFGCCGSDHGPMGLGGISCGHHWVWWRNKYEMSLNSSCFIVINLKGLLLRFDNT